MTRNLVLLFVIVMLWQVPAAQAGTEAEAGLPDDVARTMDAYFLALQAGDVYRIEQLVGGRLKSRFAARLTNPLSAVEIRDDNADRAFSVISWKPDDAGMVTVDYVAVDGNETIQKRAYLSAGVRSASLGTNFTIIEEIVIP